MISDSEYQAALREASAFFENEPEPGTPEGARFEVLLATIEAYESADCILANFAKISGNAGVAVKVLGQNTSAIESHRWLHERKLDPSISVILLVDASSPLVIVHFRCDDKWDQQVVRGLDAQVDLSAIGIRFALKDVYAGTHFADSDGH